MTAFQLSSAFFPDNAIARAERIYQQRTAERPRRWRRWLNHIFMGLVIIFELIQFGFLLLTSLMQRDPTPIIRLLGSLPLLLFMFALFQSLTITSDTIALASYSVTREKDARTWEMLVLTGIDARQIVRGKWWATVQRQFPHYLLLGIIRTGATAALALSIFSTHNHFSAIYYTEQMQFPHPLTILIAVFFGMLLTVATLGFSAACSVLASAACLKSPITFVRGFDIQIALSLIPAIAAYLLIDPINNMDESLLSWIFAIIVLGIFSLADNGYFFLSNLISIHYQPYTGGHFSPIAPIELYWVLPIIFTLGFYALLIWFALWGAEKCAVWSLATPFNKPLSTSKP